MVHLPFYLQNSGLRKVAAAQQAAAKVRLGVNSSEDGLVMGRSLSARRLSSETALISASMERLGGAGAGAGIGGGNANRKGSRKVRLSDSVASSIGSNLNRLGGTITAQSTGGTAGGQQQHDLSRMLLTDDYFSDVNPRSMRRLMNVIYVTGRLLKAFKIDFSWYRLASWINITEQWPFRTSHLIHHFELLCGGIDAVTDNQQQQQVTVALDDNTSLKTLYDRIRANIPNSRDIEPLLELDRGDERKFDVFLSYHRTTLQVADLKVFLPFTINLDPYLRKVIKEECCQLEYQHDPSFINHSVNGATSPPGHRHLSSARSAVVGTPTLANGGSGFVGDWPSPPARRSIERTGPQMYPMQLQMPVWPPSVPIAPVTAISAAVLGTPLSSLSLDALCTLLEQSLAPDVSLERVHGYCNHLRANNVTGRVLAHCDLSSGGGELRQLLGMTFGDWELFKVLVVSMRADEVTRLQVQQQSGQRHHHYLQLKHQIGTVSEQTINAGLSATKDHNVLTSAGGHKSHGSDSDGGTGSNKTYHIELSSNSTGSRNKQSIMEKQVTLEDQMICGALQTLNEEACEDVLEEVGLDMTVVPTVGGVMVTIGAPTCLVVPPSPDTAVLQPGTNANADDAGDQQLFQRASKRGSIGGETEFLILQSSPMGGTLPWQPLCCDAASDSLSEYNSSRSTSPRHSPILDGRATTVNLRMSNLKDRDKETLIGENERRTNTKHVVICADTRSNCSTKLLNNCFNSRPLTLNLLKQQDDVDNTKEVELKRTRSKSIDVGGRKNSFGSRGLDTIAAKLRQRFLLHSNPELSEDCHSSGPEHTPLVNSTPSTSLHSPVDNRQAVMVPVAPSIVAVGSGSECSLSLSMDSSKLHTASSASLSSFNGLSPTILTPATLPPSI